MEYESTIIHLGYYTLGLTDQQMKENRDFDVEWQRLLREQEQYATQHFNSSIMQAAYYGTRVETVTKTTEVRTIVYTFPELDLD
jgi:hypothetical protein